MAEECIVPREVGAAREKKWDKMLRVMKLYKQGCTRGMIAERTGINRKSVEIYIREYDVPEWYEGCK